MAFTPYSTPIQYEYKPLNLAAFAVPLGKMQEQLDLTKAAISSTDFDLAHLPYGSDPERAKELIATARAKRDELAKNLMETKNYRQAAIKLNELNKTWKLDPEKSALESNYKLWQERDKEERERIDNGKANQITRDQYLQWKAKEIRNYEAANEEGKTGAAFKASWEKPEGDYRTVTGSTGRLADLEDELQELSFKAAQAVETDTVESALALIGIDATTMDAHYKKRIVESRSKEKTAEAVRDYLLTQPKYKQWAEEVAHYNHLDMQYSGKYADYAGEIVGSALKDNEQSIKDREAYLKKVKGKKEEDPVYANLLERKDLLSNMKSTGEYDPKVVEKLYTAQHVAGVFNFDALGKLFETRKENTEDVFRTIPKEDDGSGGGGTKNIFGSDAFFHPDTDTEYTPGGFQSQIHKASKGLYPIVKDLNNVAAGNVRTAIYAGLNAAEKEKLQKDPGAILARQRNLFTSSENASNVQEFIKNAKSKGINLSLANASTLWKTWHTGDRLGAKQFSENLENARELENNYVSATENLKNLKTEIHNTQEFKDKITELDKRTPVPIFNYTKSGNLASTNYKFNERSEKLFRSQNYTIERLTSKLGISKEKAEQYRKGNQVLTFGEVARLRGYKNTEEALAKGFDFGGVYFDAERNMTLTNYLNKVETEISPSLKTEKMSYNLLNTPQVSKELMQMNTTIEELMQQDPAFKGSWNQIPGFSEDGKPLAGTKLLSDNAHPPVITTHGNSLYFKYYYEYKDPETGSTIPTSVVVKPKLGTINKNEQWIDNLLYLASGNDASSKATRDMLLVNKFDMIYENKLTQSSFDAIPVQEGQTRKLETIALPYAGQSLVFTKEKPKGAMEPIIKIYRQMPDGSKAALDINGQPGGNGQIYTTTDPQEAKRFAASLLVDVAPR